jgi:hypothetical protein
MALWTNPIVVSDDGGTTTDRSFSFLAQDVSNPNSVTGVWIEDAADVTAESKVVAKHDQRTLSKGFKRDLVSRRVMMHPALDTETDDLQPLTLNITLVGDSRFSTAEIQPELNILIDLISQAGFVTSLRQGKI